MEVVAKALPIYLVVEITVKPATPAPPSVVKRARAGNRRIVFAAEKGVWIMTIEDLILALYGLVS